MGSILRRATFSPTAALLQLLVVSLLATFRVFHNCGATTPTTNIAMLATCRPPGSVQVAQCAILSGVGPSAGAKTGAWEHTGAVGVAL